MITQFANALGGNTNSFGGFPNMMSTTPSNGVMGVSGRILSPTEIVDYSTIVMGAYPPQAIASEPFIGFKILVRDPATAGYAGNMAMRFKQIEANLAPIMGKGILIRETDYQQCPDGYWIITLPVPRSQISIAIRNLADALMYLERAFGFVKTPCIEIDVSGRCGYQDVERTIGGLMIPDMYQKAAIQCVDSPYRFGKVERINEQFILFRTRWDLTHGGSNNISSDMLLLGQLLASMYH